MHGIETLKQNLAQKIQEIDEVFGNNNELENDDGKLTTNI